MTRRLRKYFAVPSTHVSELSLRRALLQGCWCPACQNGKGELVPVINKNHTTKTYRGLEAQLHAFLTSAIVSLSSQPIYPRPWRIYQVVIRLETGWAPDTISTLWRTEKCIFLVGNEFRFSGHPACSLIAVLSERSHTETIK
jgi:hypothetical protein